MNNAVPGTVLRPDQGGGAWCLVFVFGETADFRETPIRFGGELFPVCSDGVMYRPVRRASRELQGLTRPFLRCCPRHHRGLSALGRGTDVGQNDGLSPIFGAWMLTV